jgi:nicotinate-nucleotide adenylyltransferase
MHARDELALDRVLLMPVHTSPNKPPAADPGAEHRLRMCELAVAGMPGLEASALEVERGGTSYTVDTLKAIHSMHPDASLRLIVGADTARTLGSWHAPAALLELADLAVALRSGTGREQVLDTLAGLGTEGASAVERARFLTMEEIEVSSSLVRERVAREGSIEDLVGPAVARYIAEHDLYRTPIEVVS